MNSVIPSRTEIRLFDVHTCLPPIDDPNLFQADFRCLGAPIDYDKYYWMETFTPTTEHFQFQPLQLDEIQANHLWKRLPSSKPWYAPFPLVAKLSELEIELAAEDLGLRLPVDVWVFLWPWGWSSNLRVSFDCQVPLPALAELTASFKSAHPRRAFLSEGKPVKPTTIFGKLGTWVASEVYNSAGLLRDRLGLPRHFVLSIFATQGEALPYRPIPFLGPRRVSTDDRALLHSMVSSLAGGLKAGSAGGCGIGL